LLAENPNQLSFDINAYQAFFEKGFEAWQQQNWNDAILHFKKALAIYPEDTVVPVFLQRCKDAMPE
jgi:adenylate cyclase